MYQYEAVIFIVVVVNIVLFKEHVTADRIITAESLNMLKNSFYASILHITKGTPQI